MSNIHLGEFDKFIIYGKTCELLACYGIKPVSVLVDVSVNPEKDYIGWSLCDLATDGQLTRPDPEQHERVKRLYADLGEGLGIDGVDTILFTSYAALYDKLANAIEKAPKSFTRLR